MSSELPENKDYKKEIDNLFRREAGKITSVLTKIFGVKNIQIAEDVVQDTLLKALQQWSFTGIPENPAAWLYQSSKNRAIDLLRKDSLKEKYSSEISAVFKSEWSLSHSMNEVFLEDEIKDSQLRMMFTCCHPDLPGETQVALALKHLCGFSVKEIAKAFLTNEETIAKRLTRAKSKLNSGQIGFEIPSGKEAEARLANVLSTLYLLFNEGYNSSGEKLIRNELMSEAIYLAELLTDHPLTSKPETHALLSLMLFHFARTPARLDEHGGINLLEEQDRTLWNKSLIEKAIRHLEFSASGGKVTEYHLEAGIANYYTVAGSYEKTDWQKILNLYNILYKRNPSYIIGLNRAVIIANIYGPESGLNEVHNLPEQDKLKDYYLYHSVIGELYSRNNQKAEAKMCFVKALKLTNSKPEKDLLKRKIEIL